MKWIKAFIPPILIFYILNAIHRGCNPLTWVFYDYQVPLTLLMVFFLIGMGITIKFLILDVLE